MKNLKNASSFLLILILLVSCSTVKISDHEWCGDAGPYGASCFHTLSDRKRDIPKETWDIVSVGPDHRFGMICTSAESFANWKEALLKLCTLAKKRCTYIAKKKIIEFTDRIDEFSNSLISVSLDEEENDRNN
jgi:hypothetical protein